MADPFYSRHRGPYQLQVFRDKARRAGSHKYPGEVETLTGQMSGPDALEEALMLLGDPRDTIQSVYVWSVSEEAHVGTY